ncbi:MAG: DUF3368 domain-containing protein [Bacteroidota bacterium]|nr:DUF3368 domain-containing protein [Bacteroidota bacterium]
MIVISDSSCLINLATIQLLSILPDLFQEVIIPKAVYNEIAVSGAGQPGEMEIKEARWIKVLPCHNQQLLNRLLADLDEGEAEAIVLALEQKADLLIMDEAKGRAFAAQLGLRFTGLLGILLMAKEKLFIPEIKPYLNLLRPHFWISEAVMKEVLRLSGEEK